MHKVRPSSVTDYFLIFFPEISVASCAILKGGRERGLLKLVHASLIVQLVISLSLHPSFSGSYSVLHLFLRWLLDDRRSIYFQLLLEVAYSRLTWLQHCV